ncbi:MAG: multicopper oxidase domain-containing protein [Betaproteobacteria bacterium]|nr:multicopper oxidase domain-containing protein [Betaproteobacteria bacterium]
MVLVCDSAHRFRRPARRSGALALVNRGGEPHPMHVHGTQFQVVSRDGVAGNRLPTDLGWKDTVLVRPMETVEIVLRFAVAGNYVLHCHNLEHEDDGMMLNFDVV